MLLTKSNVIFPLEPIIEQTNDTSLSNKGIIYTEEILFEFDNQEDAYNKENELVDENFVKRRDTYNTSIGGKGWFIGIDVHNKNKITVHSPITDKNYYINENDLQKLDAVKVEATKFLQS